MAKGKGSGGSKDTYPGETPNMIGGKPNPLSKGEIKMLEEANYDAHDLKRGIYGRNAEVKLYDIFKDKDGYLFTNDKTGSGEWKALYLNINDIKKGLR